LSDAFVYGGQVNGRAFSCSTCFHWTTAYEDCRNVDANGTHHHPGHGFVAVGNADNTVKLVSLKHCFNRIRDEFSTRKRVSHPGMTHGKSIIDCYGVELEWDAACFSNR
jgi:hypothetical protein